MIVRVLTVATLVGLVFAQTPGPGSEDATKANGLADIVLTIHGICSQRRNPPAGSERDCTVRVGRQQFEDLLKVAVPGSPVTPAVRRTLAKTYTELLAFGVAGEKSGLDNSPQFQESVEWLRLRTLADFYRRSLEKSSGAASEPEIEAYYLQNTGQFEEVKLRRMLVPKNNFAISDKRESEEKALEIATAFRERAAKGEDLDQLQKEAYTAAGFSSLPPATLVGVRRRSGLASDVSQDVFALQPGEVSKVENEEYSFVVYKVDAKRMVPKEQAREEIAREIVKHKREAALKSVMEGIHTDLDEDYFGPATEK